MVSVDLMVTAAHVAKHMPSGANDRRACSLTAEQTLRFAQAVVDGMFAKDDNIVKYTHNGYLKRWYTLPTPYKAGDRPVHMYAVIKSASTRRLVSSLKPPVKRTGFTSVKP